MTTRINGETGINRVQPGAVGKEDLDWVPPFTKEYISPEQTIAFSELRTLPHSFGAVPKFYRLSIICKIAEHGYSIGDVLEVPHFGDVSDSTGAVRGVSLVGDATNINIRYVGNAVVWTIINKSTGVPAGITVANWRLIVRAWA